MTQTDAALPTKTLWTMVGLLSASMAINLVDRQVMAVLAAELRSQFQWSNAQYAYVAVAFNLGMMLGQIPAGAFLDRVGTKVGLATLFVGWSILCVAQAAAGPGTVIESLATNVLSLAPGLGALGAGLAGFMVLRFIMGLFQCGNYTAGIKALAGLVPSSRRSTAGGIFSAGAQLGSLIAPPIVLYVASHHGWRQAFVIPAVIGAAWLLPWLFVAPSRARVAALASQQPGAVAADPPASPTLLRLLINRKVLGLLCLRIFTGPATTFYWTWLPLYLRTGRGMSWVSAGLLASVPYLIGMCGNVVGGALTDRLVVSTGSADKGRKIALACALGLGTLSMAMPFVGNDTLALVLMGLALFGSQWVAAAYIGAVGDIVPQHVVGRVNGIAGVGDNGAALLAVLYTGFAVDRFGWTPVFLGAGALPCLALLSLFVILKKIEPARF